MSKELYSDIEDLIIRWSNDGTKTAGHLTRQIMEILITQKHKQETLEEAAERLYPHKPFWIGSGKSARLYDEFKTQRDSFIEGAKWQQERRYSEEEVNSIFYAICKHSFFEDNVETVYLQDVKDEFEQFKNK